jgi:hypothetical protein
MLGMSVQNESRVPYLRDPVKWYVVRVCALGASPLVLVFALGELLGVQYTTRKRAHSHRRCHETMSILPSSYRGGASCSATVLVFP